MSIILSFFKHSKMTWKVKIASYDVSLYRIRNHLRAMITHDDPLQCYEKMRFNRAILFYPGEILKFRQSA